LKSAQRLSRTAWVAFYIDRGVRNSIGNFKVRDCRYENRQTVDTPPESGP